MGVNSAQFISLCSTAPLSVIKEAAHSIADFNATDSNGFTPLYAALGRKDHIVVRFLIKKGANVNYVRPGGYSPMFYGYRRVEYQMILISFLYAGYNPNVVNKNNETLMHIFSRRSLVMLCRVIFLYSKVPIDLEAKDNKGDTIPDIIMAGDSKDLQQLLALYTCG